MSRVEQSPQEIVAEIVSQRSHQIPGKLTVTEYVFKVPLNYADPTGEALEIFARSAETFIKPIDEENVKQTPWLLYLQGGPGFPCSPAQQGGWQGFLIEKGYKLLLMDQRGCGSSSTITADTLERRGDPQKQADYLKHFRADNIVRDAEAIRKILTKDYHESNKKWSILGQSFGGFCAIHYLSFHPEGLKEVFTTGGMAPPVRQPDKVYNRLLKKSIEMSTKFYDKFPEDILRVRRIIEHLQQNPTNTYDGGVLSPYRIQNLGMLMISTTGWETLHSLLLRADIDLMRDGKLQRPTIVALQEQVAFDSNVLYAIIHEACYLSGSASKWSAERALAANPAFKLDQPADQPIMFLTENITHDTFESYGSLKQILPAAEILAAYDGWPELYDSEQLARNEVPVYASIYVDDLAIDFEMAMERAKGIKNCKTYITNRSWHSGLREQHEEVLGALFALRDDVMA